MKKQNEPGRIAKNLRDIRSVIFEDRPEDSTAKKATKTLGWYMVITLFICAVLGIVFAASFAH